MTAPSYTYALTNGNTADASQVTQNFNDILNGVTDGTKDLSISALTCAGTATFNGNVNIGNATADDLVITASLAGDIVPKTPSGTYNLGSATFGFLSLYLAASGDGDTAQIIAAAHAADRAYTVPDCGAAASFVMTQLAQTISGTKTFDGQLIGKGTATNDSAAAGYIGEYFENVRSTNSPSITSATVCSVDSGNSTFNDNGETGIALTAGDWDILGTVTFTYGGATITTNVQIWIGTGKGTSATGSVASQNTTELITTFSAGAGLTLITPVWRVSISSPTTYYLKAYTVHASGTGVTAIGSIRARRIR